MDGANFHRALRRVHVRADDVDVEKVARKLARGRRLERVCYFIARVERDGGAAYEANRRLIADLAARSAVRLFLGFIQRQRETNRCAEELSRFLRSPMSSDLSPYARRLLDEIARRHAERFVFREKGVDVALAVELVRQARDGEFDLAFLISADGDFHPAADLVRRMGRQVIAAGPVIGRRLRDACDATIRLERDWFRDCLR